MPRTEGIRAINWVVECEWCGETFGAHRRDAKLCVPCQDRPQKRRKPTVLPRPESHDLAWAAGFFDGEGCFTGGGRGYLQLAIAQKLPTELIDKFAALFGVGGVYQWERGGHSYVTFMCHGRKAFYIADLLWPWLGERKKSDFKRVLAQTPRRVRKTRGERFVYAESP